MNENNLEIVDEEIEKAQKNYNNIKLLKERIGGGLILLGGLLYENKEKRYWEKLGHTSFNSFLASPEFSFHQKTGQKLIYVYETFVKKLKLESEKIKDVDIDKLQIIAPICDEKNCDDWIETARQLSRTDLREEVQGIKQEKEQKENLESWSEYSDVWTKRQPLSRWGKNPKDENSMFGQFVGNLIKYYTKQQGKVVNLNVEDSVISDACEELIRKYEKVTDIENIVKLNGNLAISVINKVSDVFYSGNVTQFMNLIKNCIKSYGHFAIYIKDKNFNESRIAEFFEKIRVESKEEIKLLKQIIIQEELDFKNKNIALRDNEMFNSYERILVLRFIDSSEEVEEVEYVEAEEIEIVDNF